MELPSDSGSSHHQNIIIDSQPHQFIQLQGEVIQPHHIVEIQQQELEPNIQQPDFSILQPDAEANRFEVVYSGDVTARSEDSTGMEYTFQDVTSSIPNSGVIVEYESGDAKNIELVYSSFPDGDQNQSQDDDMKMLTRDLQLVSDAKEIGNMGGFELVRKDEAVEKVFQEETVEGEDICKVRVEVSDQVYLEDMKNIDIFVVYSCKKCGYGDQNVVDAIHHTRNCTHPSAQEELHAKLSKVFNLFKTFSHRSVPLSECIAPPVNPKATENKATKVTERSQLPKSIANLKPKEESDPRGISEDDIEEIVNKCKEAWKEAGDIDSSVVIEPRKWFCTLCSATVIFSETEYGYHMQCHTKELDSKKFSCPLCKTSDEGRRKVLECDDWNTMKTHLTSIHKVNMKLECPVCSENYPSHQRYHKHVRSHKHQCRFPNCGFSSTTQQTIFTHERCHNLEDTSQFKCLKCEWVSETLPHKWSQMHIHLTKDHPGTIEPLYKCQLCSREFTELRRFNNHMMSCKNLPVPLKPTCLVCGKPVNDSDLRDHILKHASTKHWFPKMREVLSKSPEEYLARTLGTNVTAVSQNLETTESEVPGLQKITKPMFVTSTEIEKRVMEKEKGAIENKEKQYTLKKNQRRVLVSSGLLTEKCKFCYKKFATQQRLEKHIKRSHPDNGTNPTVCDTCGSSFRNKEQWRNHNRQVHLGIKRKAVKTQKSSPKLYMCDTCTYATPNMARLRNHFQSVHLGKQPFECKQCTYKTNEPSDLRRHMLKHEGKKPYSCEHCDYKTTQRWILVNHTQRVHGIQLPKKPHNTFGCEYSMKRNPTISGLRREAESSQVQIEELNGEVMLQIDESEGITSETVQILASLARSNSGGLVTVQEQDLVDEGQHIVAEEHQIVTDGQHLVTDGQHIVTEGQHLVEDENQVIMIKLKEEEDQEEGDE